MVQTLLSSESEVNSINVQAIVSRPATQPTKGASLTSLLSEPRDMQDALSISHSDLLPLSTDGQWQALRNEEKSAQQHCQSENFPTMDDGCIKAILCITGSKSCCGLSKSTCMQAWTPSQVATWLVTRHGLHSALVIAASTGLVKVCSALLSRPKQPAKANDQDSAALRAAAAAGHIDICHLLLQQSNNAAQADDASSAALCEAAHKGHLAVCQLLLGLHHRPAKAADKSSAALQAAAACGALDICKVLLQQHSNPAKADDADSAALQTAAGNGHLGCCDLLLQFGARADDAGSGALREAASGGHLAVCQMLLSQKKHPARADARESAALQNAAARGHLDVCKLLLGWKDHPARAAAKDSSALRYAAAGGHLAVCELLLSQKQHPARPDDWGSAPLRDAAAHGHADVCKLLLAYKVHPARAYDLDLEALSFVSTIDVNAAQLLKLRKESLSQNHSFCSETGSAFTPICSLPLPSVCETAVSCEDLPRTSSLPEPIKEDAIQVPKYPTPLPPVARNMASKPRRRQTSWFSCF